MKMVVWGENKNNWLALLIFLFLASSMSQVFSLTVGSNSAVSLEPQPIFPAFTDNQILGFARMESGFVLADENTTMTYRNFFHVAGAVNLSGGKLVLREDITFDNFTSFVNGGIVIGDFLAFELPRANPHVTILSSGGGAITGFEFITSNNYQDGDRRIWALDWNFDDNYVASGSENTGNEELVIYYFDGATLTTTQVVEQGAIVNSVRWHPTQNYLAVARDGAAGEEFQLFSFNVSNGTLTLTGSADYAGNDAKAVAWHSSGNFLTVGGTNNAKEIITYSFNDITGVATEKSVVNLSPDRDVNKGALDYSPGGNLLAVGVTASAGDELLVYSFNNGVLTLNSSIGADRGIETLDWNPTGTYIAAGTFGSGTGDLRIYAHNAASNTLTLVVQEIANDVNAVAWDQTGQYLAVGLEAVAGPNLRVYFFDKENLTLTDLGAMPVPSDEDNYAVRFSHNNQYLAAGDHSSRTVIYGALGGLNEFLLFENTKVIFNSDVIFNVPVHFRGSCVITGRGNGLNFMNGGNVTVRPDSTLMIEDIEIRNLGKSNIRCLTDSAEIVYRNARLTLAQDYTFSHGSIVFDPEVVITGTNKFIYSSNVGSTIDSQSSLIIDRGVTFSYAPMGPYHNLIHMEDPTSILYLDGCTLHSTRTGLHLAGGTLIIDNAVTVSSEARYFAEAISFSTDLNVHLLSSANLQLFGLMRTD